MPSSYKRAVERLDARGFGIKADLERIRAIAGALDDPQLTYPTIHLAGTNGKTTTARAVAGLLAAHGLVVGLYTSPHLQTVRERLALVGDVDGAPVSDLISAEEFAELSGYLMPFVEMVENERDQQVTYFEFLTAMAFEWMSDKAVAAGVYEAGLGGRWDATNLVESRVAVFSHIAVDHRRLLGTTPVENAREKAGIVKPGSTIVSAEQDPDVADVISRAAGEAGATSAFLGQDALILSDLPAVGGRLISVKGLYDTYEDVPVPLFGAHQARNGALALMATEAFLGKGLDRLAVEAAFGALRSPGRLEVVSRDPLTVLDGAHNPDGAAALAAAIRETFIGANVTLVLSIFEDKDVAPMLAELLPIANKVIATSTSSPRSLSADALAQLIGARDVDVIEDLGAAIDAARTTAGSDDIVLVAGSLMTVGEARDHLLGPVA